jgi:thioredoxin-like negative regulator of GroEL
MLSPTLEQYTEDKSITDGKEFDLVTVDIDKQQELAAQYQVRAYRAKTGSVSNFLLLLWL